MASKIPSFTELVNRITNTTATLFSKGRVTDIEKDLLYCDDRDDLTPTTYDEKRPSQTVQPHILGSERDSFFAINSDTRKKPAHVSERTNRAVKAESPPSRKAKQTQQKARLLQKKNSKVGRNEEENDSDSENETPSDSNNKAPVYGGYQIRERYAGCRCLYYQHALQMSATYEYGHPIQERTVLVGNFALNTHQTVPVLFLFQTI